MSDVSNKSKASVAVGSIFVVAVIVVGGGGGVIRIAGTSTTDVGDAACAGTSGVAATFLHCNLPPRDTVFLISLSFQLTTGIVVYRRVFAATSL